MLREGNMAQFFANLVTTSPICDTTALGITTNEIPFGFRILPNPNSGEFTVAIDELSPESAIEIYDCFGNLILKQYLINEQTKIKLSVSPGVYFIEVGTPIKKIRSRMVIRNHS